MSRASSCPKCGAALSSRDADCPYCGAAVAPAAPIDPRGPAIAARLAAVRGHPEFDALSHRTPSTDAAERPMRQTAAFGTVFAVIAAVMLVVTCVFAGVFAGIWGAIAGALSGEDGLVIGPDGMHGTIGEGPGLAGGGIVGALVFVGVILVFGGLPIAFIVVGVKLSRASKANAEKLRRARLERLPAYVSGERTLVTGGGSDRSAVTTYHATLQFEDGSREEFPVDGRIAGTVDAGDVGVAYLKGGYLIDFARLDV